MAPSSPFPSPSPSSVPAHYADVLVTFEDVALYPGTHTAFTWRVGVAYADPDNWVIEDVDLDRDGWGRKWVTLQPWHPLRPVLVERSLARDLCEKIDAAILADMERRGLSFDDGCGTSEHRLGRAQLGVGV